MAFTAKAQDLQGAGMDVIGLGAGEPDFDTPQFIKDAAIRAMAEGKTKYAPPAGLFELREAACRKFKRENNLDYTPDQISSGVGGKQSILKEMMAQLDPAAEGNVCAHYRVSNQDRASS